MNKLASIMSLQPLGQFGPSNFPGLDPYHAHCTISVRFRELTCQNAFNLNKDNLEVWHPDESGNGSYELWDAIEEEQIWVARHSKSEQIDDVMFSYFPETDDFRNPGCTVGAKSRSRTIWEQHFDDTNFCNIYNVIEKIPGFDDSMMDVKDCGNQPKDPHTACQKY